MLRIKPRKHVVDYDLWVFKARVVASYDHAVALFHGLDSHQRTLSLVAIAACATHGDNLSLAVQHLVNGIQHILQGIGCVGIVNNNRVTFGRTQRFKPTVNAVQGAHHQQDVFGTLAQHHCRAVNCQQVANIKLANELHTHLGAVYFEIHPFEVALQNLRLEVGHAPCRIGLHRGARVLNHHHSVLIVGIGNGKRLLGQHVEEGFLGIAIVLEGFVIVQMVACEVREHAAGEGQSANALLRDGMRTALHKHIFAPRLHHPMQQGVKRDGIRRGMVGRYGLVFDVVAHRGKQSATMAELSEHIV